jgi:hypothetical protein
MTIQRREKKISPQKKNKFGPLEHSQNSSDKATKGNNNISATQFVKNFKDQPAATE